MESPITGKKMPLMHESATLEFRKEEFQVVYHYYLCEDTGERFTDDALDGLNISQVQNQYRVKYGIPFPDEIKAIRELYAISASKMSEILGFGINSYRLYESGEIPSVSNGRLILAIRQPANFIRQLLASTHLLIPKEIASLTAKAQRVQSEVEGRPLNKEVKENTLHYNTPDEYTGYRNLHPEKIAEIIHIFSQSGDLYKTKLNKMLFYADFLYFKRTGFSITGLAYRAIPFGPVPAEYDRLLLRLSEEGKLEITEKLVGGGIYAEVMKGISPPGQSTLAHDELETIKSVGSTLGHLNTQEIVAHSHQESAWLENKNNRSLISYPKYAFDLIEPMTIRKNPASQS